MDTSKRIATQPPDHEAIREDAAAHPERTPSEHEDAARRIAARTYVEDLRRIQARGLVEEEENG